MVWCDSGCRVYSEMIWSQTHTTYWSKYFENKDQYNFNKLTKIIFLRNLLIKKKNIFLLIFSWFHIFDLEFIIQFIFNIWRWDISSVKLIWQKRELPLEVFGNIKQFLFSETDSNYDSAISYVAYLKFINLNFIQDWKQFSYCIKTRESSVA